MSYYYLTEFDCPQIRLYLNGDLYDEYLDTDISVSSDGRIRCYSLINETYIRLSYRRVCGFYFNSPFSNVSRQRYPVRCLGFMGFSNYFIEITGRVFSLKYMIYLVNGLDSKRYHFVTMRADTGEYISHRIHQLLARAFIPNPYNHSCVNHINGVKTDNNLTNLEWCSIYENNKHAMENHLVSGRKLTPDEEVHRICLLLQQGYTNSQISYVLNISPEKVRSIKKGAHRCIAQFYDFKRTKAFPYMQRFEENKDV